MILQQWFEQAKKKSTSCSVKSLSYLTTAGFASGIMQGWTQLQCTAKTKDVSAQYNDSESFEQRHRPARSSKAADGTLTGRYYARPAEWCLAADIRSFDWSVMAWVSEWVVS